jgi:DNA-binding SARP family transcriptional activator
MDEAIQAELTDYFADWVKEMAQWRASHPQATLVEIEEYARIQRRELMSRVLKPLIEAAPSEIALCPQCGEAMTDKGEQTRQIETREAPTRIERPYVYCPVCRTGLFPPR